MIVIRRSEAKASKCTPHALPCEIDYNGPVNATERYWKPEQKDDGTSTAYFRGRKLRANNVPVPEGYEGVVLQLTDETIPSSAGEQDCLVTSKSHANDYRDDGEDEEGEEEEEEEEDLKVMEQVASFGDIAVWGHELVPSDEENPYQKAVTEWATFAGKIHSYDIDDTVEPLGHATDPSTFNADRVQ